MSSIFHDGELEIQKRAGVEEMSRRIGASIRSVIPPVAQQFLLHQPMIVIAGLAESGKVWTSLITGLPGFMLSPNETTLRINALPAPGDPIWDILKLPGPKKMGFIIVEFYTRRRMRVNGYAELLEDGITVTVEQVYSNCHKRIQPRQVGWDLAGRTVDVRRSIRLNERQKNWILEADTFLIGSAHPEYGADASHRGGEPGFVQIVDDKTLLFPDYKGNSLFNTLGNIAIYPRIGILFIEFSYGHTLQLSGRAQIHWETDKIAAFSGAERVVELFIEEIVEIMYP